MASSNGNRAFARLLDLCAGRPFDPLPVDAEEWTPLIALAARHRVQPLVVSALATVGDDVLPEAVAGWCRAEVAETARKAKLVELRFQHIARRARDAGEEVRVIKGGALSTWLYGSRTARHVGDLDILVRPEGVATVDGQLRRMGYACPVPRDVVETPLLRVAHHVLEYEGVDGRPPVELHWRWTRNPHFLPFDAARVWSGEGGEDDGTARAETIVYLFVHGGHHAWCRLKWLVDVHRLCAAGIDPAPDWDLVRDRAAQLGVRRALDLGLVLARDLLGTTPPFTVDDRSIAGLVGECRSQLDAAAPSAANPTGIEAIRRQLDLLEGSPRVLRALAHHVLTPTVADIAAVPRRARSGPVLAALRPVLWAVRALRSPGDVGPPAEAVDEPRKSR